MPQLTLDQRYEIASLLKQGYNNSEIAENIGVHKSSIGREIKRNCDKRNEKYTATLAQKKTQERHANKPKHTRFTKSIKSYVISLIQEDYSPEQISGIAQKEGIPCVSHECIYQFIWDDKKKGGRLFKHLRNKGKKYKKRGGTNAKRGQIKDRVSIHQRPEIVDRKERFGDLEIDLIIGENHKSALLTINDRATGMLKMAHLNSKEAKEIEQKTVELLEPWSPFIHTITSDNGKEFANHKEIAENLNIDFYFADPYHSWQRGANENLNGLVRQYFPKNTSFENITQIQIDTVVSKLNNRPRKRYDFDTPIQRFDKLIEGSEVAFMT